MLKLKEMDELELVQMYKNSESIRLKDRCFTEMARRYKNYLKNQANRFYTSVPCDYFAFDFEDCEYEALYCLKLAMNYFDINSVSEKFEEDKFSIAYYVQQQMRSRIASYNTKYNTKQSRSVEYENVDFASYDCQDEVRSQEKLDINISLNSLNNRICDVQRKIKDFLMEGLKESTIRSQLRLTKNGYESYKNQLRKNMIAVGLTL